MDNIYKRSFWIVLVLLLGGGIWWLQAASPPAPAAMPAVQSAGGPTITWSVPQLAATLFPGTSSTAVVTFRSDQNLAGVVVEATPSLNGIVSLSPTSFPSITADQDYQLTLTLTAPPEFLKREFGGTIHTRNNGEPPKTYATPLEVVLRTDFLSFSDTNFGVQFFLPTAMAVTPIRNSIGTTLYVHDTAEEFPGGGITITKAGQRLATILARIASTLTLVSSVEQTFNAQPWTLNLYIDPRSDQQFIDAFTIHNGSVYQVGGPTSPAVANLLPALLSSFLFM